MSGTTTPGDPDPWSADHPAVWAEKALDADGVPRVAMLRHPTHPYLVTVDEAHLDSGLFEAATRYLEKVRSAAGIDAAVVHALRGEHGDFGWLGIAWGLDALGAVERDPAKSFWVTRHVAGREVDRTAVLLAGRRVGAVGEGDEVGLRVVVHVADAGSKPGRCRVRITGLSMSNLASAVGAAQAAESAAPRSAPDLAGSDTAQPADRTPAPPSSSDTDEKSAAPPHPVFVLAAAITRSPAGLPGSRPTAPDAVLDGPRVIVSTGPAALYSTASGQAPAVALAMPGYLEVRQTRVGNAGARPEAVFELRHPEPTVRSDDFAAVSAYTRGAELFDRLLAYGLRPQHYFKLARLPLIVRHRAPLPGAGDGNTVNAAVRRVGDEFVPADDHCADKPGDRRPQLAVHFGAANLSHRALLPNDDNRLRAQPLGLAADPRWAWHEFGHVLNYASFGALEFRFAHSAGDALAAIAADPDAWPASATPAAPHDRSRYRTFSWVRLPRRHDREATASWCWCGRRNRVRLANAPGWAGRRLGYFGEQLMSSSLFRLYRAIGGDTVDEPAMRRSASDYTLYLIMRAIALLGPAGVVPARTVDHFVSALIDADLGTGRWHRQSGVAGLPPVTDAERVRQGGHLHKVIRWAFERQGLYATDDPAATEEGPGQPPPVDIYIPDNRPSNADGGASDGGYHPVPLSWQGESGAPWHASAQALRYDEDRREVVVMVHSRGQHNAENVTVGVRVSPAEAKGARSWTPLPRSEGRGARTVRSNADAVEFRFSAVDVQRGALHGKHLVWAAATCPADRSNIDPKARLHRAGTASDLLLLDLVAGDNNQGLAILSFS